MVVKTDVGQMMEKGSKFLGRIFIGSIILLGIFLITCAIL